MKLDDAPDLPVRAVQGRTLLP